MLRFTEMGEDPPADILFATCDKEWWVEIVVGHFLIQRLTEAETIEECWLQLKIGRVEICA